MSRRRSPVAVNGIWLRTEGQYVIVDVELEPGYWVEAIRDFSGMDDVTISHIVEPGGIRIAPPSRLNAPSTNSISSSPTSSEDHTSG